VQGLIDDALWWITEFDLDGFRVDATKHINSNYLRYLRYRLDRAIASEQTPFYMVGENFIYDYGLIGQKISAHELQGQFDFPLYGTVRYAFGESTPHYESINTFVYQNFIDQQSIAGLDWAAPGYAPDHTLLGIFLGNHDVTRFSSMAAGQESAAGGCQYFETGSPPQPTDDTIYQRMAQAFTFLLAVRGLPVIYYGDEIGLAGVRDPDNRRPMTFDLAGLTDAQLALRDRVARMAQLRNEHPALRTGRYDAFWGDPGCLAFAKADAGESLIVLLAGPAGCSYALPIKGGFGIIDDDVLVDLLPGTGGATYTVSAMSIDVAVPAWGAQVLVRQ